MAPSAALGSAVHTTTRRNNDPDNPRKILVDRIAADEPLPPNILHVPPRLPDASVRIDRRPRVSDDPRDIAAVREWWERETDTLYAAALDEIRSDDYLGLEHHDALKQRRHRAVADLKAIMAGKRPAAEKARAAGVLCELGDHAGPMRAGRAFEEQVDGHDADEEDE
jgi:hypothetical protein